MNSTETQLLSTAVMGTAAIESTSRSAEAATSLKGVLSFRGKYRTLHLTWFAFFSTFVVWFSFAPFSTTIQNELGLSSAEVATIGLANIGLTVPARIFIGMALDHWGPRRVFSTLLMFAFIPNTVFAFSSSLSALVLSRLALSVVGAGFVVGIRLVAEWFPPKELGTAEGVYGGWGNFGSAFAAFTLPMFAVLIAFVTGGDNGWRWAIFSVGLIAAVYGLLFRRLVTDTPEGVTYAKPKQKGALEVTSRGAVFGLAVLTVPFNAILAVIAWRIWRVGVIGDLVLVGVIVAVCVLTVIQLTLVFKVNGPALRNEYVEEDKYPFRSVVVLCAAYFATFGSELAVVTMLPGFFEGTWGLSATIAGAAASCFAFMNLVARPTGGMLSDLFGSRKRTLAFLLVGLIVGYVLLATVSGSWPVVLAVVAAMCCSFFVQSGEGAVFAIVPLVKKRVSGQIAGLAGAAGNVGAVSFLTIRLLLIERANESPTDGFTVSSAERIFFLVLAAAALLAFAANRFLVEPKNSFATDLVVDEIVTDPAIGEDPEGVEDPEVAVTEVPESSAPALPDSVLA